MHTYLAQKDGVVYALVDASENPYANHPEQPEYEEFQAMLLSLEGIVVRFSVK